MISEENNINGIPLERRGVVRSKWLGAFFKLSFRGKAVLFLVPTIVIISLVYTMEAIHTERVMLKNEIIKKGETVSILAARNAELAILSESMEQLKRSADSLMEIKDVSSVSFYNKNFRPLIQAGKRYNPVPSVTMSPDMSVTFSEHSDFFEFWVPVFAVRAKEEIAFFQDKTSAANIREHIGWASIGLSKEVMRKSESAIIARGGLLAVLFTSVGVLLVYGVITFATRPLQELFNAVKEMREGEYTEVNVMSSRSEIGRLSAEFNRMSRAIREREQKIIESEVRIKALFERVEHAIFGLDCEGLITVANKKFSELCGDIKDFRTLFTGDDGQQYFERASLGLMRQTETVIKGCDGSEMIVVMSVYPDIDENGAISRFDGYFMDITEKKRLEDLLIQTQKMESVGLLAGGIAHDFNNILTGVLGYSSLMKDLVQGDEKLFRYADVIEKSAVRASALTRQLLGFARKGKYKMDRLGINSIVKELIAFLKETFDRSIAINCYMETNLPPVIGDSNQLYQALLNLCINARDAMPDGGRLYVRTEFYALKDERVIDFFKVPAGQYIRINVTDTGVGIPAEIKKRIFEPFFTTKDIGKGTGLGLAMVYGIIKGHRGYLNVYSEPGLGTTVRIYLPTAEGAVEEIRMDEFGEKKSKKGTILIIDDEVMIRELAKDILEAYDYHVHLAVHGNEGIRIFNEYKDSIDLVMLDMIMPGKGGRQVFKELRSIKPDVKVLISSGYGEDEYFQELFKSGTVGFLQKPFQHTELIHKVEEAMEL
ncbi:MAG: response regulator [Nitrospirae bacterium]|nr:response regulator [Nitrospirota bacterium]